MCNEASAAKDQSTQIEEAQIKESEAYKKVVAERDMIQSERNCWMDEAKYQYKVQENQRIAGEAQSDGFICSQLIIWACSLVGTSYGKKEMLVAGSVGAILVGFSGLIIHFMSGEKVTGYNDNQKSKKDVYHAGFGQGLVTGAMSIAMIGSLAAILYNQGLNDGKLLSSVKPA